MASSSLTYNQSDDFDAKLMLKSYFSATEDKTILQDAVILPMKLLHKVFSTENISGKILIDLSIGPSIYQLFPACALFKEIIILDCNDPCVEELKKWVNKDPDAHDWTFAAQIAAEEGDASGSYQDIEAMVRRKVKCIEKCDLAKENPTSPRELPKADCILSVRMLDAVCEDNNAYRRDLRHMSSLLKVRGHLILIADIHSTFFIIGEDKYQLLDYDENFLQETLNDEGYLVKAFIPIELERSSDLYEVKKSILVVAQKQ
ncbi:indolethylamine N-methyltransferase-like [Pseudophryne corroboree]|uniref:indolethylamine N-methyltransferase-like n=1 Tax=Pseudophryne corroboree TaxID=495146 RepID=UPI0030819228